MQPGGQETSDNPAALRRSSLYFQDGNIVLSLQDEDERRTRVLYRLDKTLLSRHSLVFSDIFSLPSAPGANEEYDGAPMVQLEDGNRAMEDLFQFMYNPAALVFRKHDPDTALRGWKLLRVADKYQIDGVRPFIVRQIENDWPTSLIEWHQWQGELKRLAELRGNTIVGADGSLDKMFSEPAAALRLALDYNIPSVLPAIFYILANIDIDADYDRFNGELDWPFPTSMRGAYHRWIRSARWSLLDRSILYHVLVGGRILQRRTESYGCLYYASDSCSREACDAELAVLALNHSDRVKTINWPGGPLEMLWDMCTAIKSHKKLCLRCVIAIKQNVENEMESTWNDISEIFAIETLLEKRR